MNVPCDLNVFRKVPPPAALTGDRSDCAGRDGRYDCAGAARTRRC